LPDRIIGTGEIVSNALIPFTDKHSPDSYRDKLLIFNDVKISIPDYIRENPSNLCYLCTFETFSYIIYTNRNF
jgi:hypothetical protein